MIIKLVGFIDDLRLNFVIGFEVKQRQFGCTFERFLAPVKIIVETDIDFVNLADVADQAFALFLHIELFGCIRDQIAPVKDLESAEGDRHLRNLLVRQIIAQVDFVVSLAADSIHLCHELANQFVLAAL